MSQVLIRTATPADIETIAGFLMAMAKETEDIQLDPKKCHQGVAEVFEDPNLGTYYVAELDQKIIGSTLVINEWSDWRCGVVWWIHSVYVRPEARGQKVFKKIYEYLKAEGLKDSKFRGFRLFVEKENNKAQAVYHALGMNKERYDLFEWMTEY